MDHVIKVHVGMVRVMMMTMMMVVHGGKVHEEEAHVVGVAHAEKVHEGVGAHVGKVHVDLFLGEEVHGPVSCEEVHERDVGVHGGEIYGGEGFYCLFYYSHYLTHDWSVPQYC